MLGFIDDFLNKITMYRLVLYYLIGLIIGALVLSLFGKLPFSPIALLYSTLFITIVCWLANTLFAWAFDAPTNLESVYITALILALIITPLKSLNDPLYFGFIAWAAVWAMASKYILAIGKKHLFNPAAFAVALTSFTIGQSASWWVGTAVMMPLVLVGGILVVRKIQRWDLVYSFLFTALVFSAGTAVFLRGSGVGQSLQRFFLDSSALFLGFVMLTEPLTTPPTKNLQMVYGALVGLMFSPYTHIGSYYFTPETALLAGNLFAYLTGPKRKLMLRLKEKLAVAGDTYDFVFAGAGGFNFRPGQYLEWTLPQDAPDNRGSRRYFTLASSPTETDIRLGVKFYNPASSFKQTMINMQPGQKIMAGQLAGDFSLPKDPDKKLVFIAGGIGITPFRSMIKYLLDTNQKRDIIMFYSNRNPADICYRDVFDQAQRSLGIRTIYTITDKNPAPGWAGKVGYVDGNMVASEVPDFKQRTFYISGPRSMITKFEKTLSGLGVSKSQIKTDFFPGFA